jgi:hypothetical protein
MTQEQALISLSKYCADEVRQSGRWIFWKRNIQFSPTVLLKPWEKRVNLILPEKICFPEFSSDLIINGEGIKAGLCFHLWSDILATGIKVESEDNWSEFPINQYSLLCCLRNGRILEFPLQDTERLNGQIGDLIEQYKGLMV